MSVQYGDRIEMSQRERDRLKVQQGLRSQAKAAQLLGLTVRQVRGLELTEEQQRELAKVDLTKLRDPRTGETYVLVRAEQYERMRAILAIATKRVGWDDPALDVYEQYRKVT